MGTARKKCSAGYFQSAVSLGSPTITEVVEQRLCEKSCERITVANRKRWSPAISVVQLPENNSINLNNSIHGTAKLVFYYT